MKKTNKKLTQPLDLGQRQELATWLDKKGNQLPSVVTHALSHYSLLLDGLAGNARHLSSILQQLRRALGITASSEKRKNSSDPIGASAKPGDSKPKDPIERLRLSLERASELASWHKDLAKQHRKKVKDIKLAMTKVEDIQLSEEDLAQCAKESAEYEARLLLGSGPQVKLESPKQAFMLGGDVKVEEEFAETKVNPDLLVGEEVVGRLTDERERYGFNLTVSKVSIEVEKIIVKDGDTSTRIISASTREFGPPKMDVTWEFLANTTIMLIRSSKVTII